MCFLFDCCKLITKLYAMNVFITMEVDSRSGMILYLHRELPLKKMFFRQCDVTNKYVSVEGSSGE